MKSARHASIALFVTKIKLISDMQAASEILYTTRTLEFAKFIVKIIIILESDNKNAID